MEGDGRVERRLAAQGCQNGVRAFELDDLLDVFRRDRFDIGRVGELGVGHDRGGIGVDEDDSIALVTQHAACLCARVVELTCLADDDRAGADHQDR